MKMIITAGILSAALLLAALSSVQAQNPPPKSESVAPIVILGE